MAKKHMKRQSVSLVIREMEINATVSYHPASIRKTSNKKKKKKKQKTSIGEAMEKLEPVCWRECKTALL